MNNPFIESYNERTWERLATNVSRLSNPPPSGTWSINVTTEALENFIKGFGIRYEYEPEVNVDVNQFI